MWSTIIDDIGTDGIETLLVVDAPYDPKCLTDVIYTILDDARARRKVLTQNTVKGKFKDLDLIRSHRTVLERNPVVLTLIETLFEPSARASVTSTDLLFLNAYYRRIIRARLEYDYQGQQLLPGLVITGYANLEIDATLVGLLQIIRLICKFVGIESTFTSGTFPLHKLYEPALWASITRKLITLLGETRIQPLVDGRDLPLPEVSLEDQAVYEGMKKIRQAEILGTLKTLFDLWSGSQLELSSDQTYIRVVPPLYIQRMMPHLRSIPLTQDLGN